MLYYFFPIDYYVHSWVIDQINIVIVIGLEIFSHLKSKLIILNRNKISNILIFQMLCLCPARLPAHPFRHVGQQLLHVRQQERHEAAHRRQEPPVVRRLRHQLRRGRRSRGKFNAFFLKEPDHWIENNTIFSLSLSVCISVCLSVSWLSLYALSLSLSLSVFLYLCHSLFFTFTPCGSLCQSLSFYLPFCLSVCLFFSRSVCSLSISISLSI